MIAVSEGRPARDVAPKSAASVPPLAAWGDDLLATSASQRRLTLARPFLCLVAYAVCWLAGWWWLSPWVAFLTFVAVVTATHDVVHETLGLRRRGTEAMLFLMGAVLFESGHAYRATHLQHHREFPGPDDPEGDPARMSFWGAVRHGPLFLPRLWAWAFRRSRRSADHAWLLVEAAWALVGLVAALFAWPVCPAVAAYASMALVGSWVYPLLTVHLPHHGYGAEPLTQTRTVRGRLLPALFLELTYHLEHHLYPRVPSHNLAALSCRMDAFLRAHGVVAGRGARRGIGRRR